MQHLGALPALGAAVDDGDIRLGVPLHGAVGSGGKGSIPLGAAALPALGLGFLLVFVFLGAAAGGLVVALVVGARAGPGLLAEGLEEAGGSRGGGDGEGEDVGDDAGERRRRRRGGLLG